MVRPLRRKASTRQSFCFTCLPDRPSPMRYCRKIVAVPEGAPDAERAVSVVSLVPDEVGLGPRLQAPELGRRQGEFLGPWCGAPLAACASHMCYRGAAGKEKVAPVVTLSGEIVGITPDDGRALLAHRTQ